MVDFIKIVRLLLAAVSINWVKGKYPEKMDKELMIRFYSSVTFDLQIKHMLNLSDAEYNFVQGTISQKYLPIA